MAHSFLRTLITFLLALLLPNLAHGADAPPKWLELRLGTIGAASADVLKSALNEIDKDKMDGLLIILDTPGGSLEATRTMVQDMMAAKVPVVVWVGPDGAHAGSAGTFITLASHVAAMAPGTNIGAAHPVDISGRNIDDKSDLRSKIENDTVAFMQSIADARGRNREMAASFVSNSLSITAQEALENKVIDVIAPDLKTLMKGLDGRDVKIGETTRKLQTANAELVPFERNFRHELLEIISNPNLFYLLFIVGLLGLAFEITHPGVVAPGVIGAISLILALIASSMLPVNFGAMLLILASVVFMVAEIFLPSFGALGVGGLIGFVTGSILLIDDKAEPAMRISRWLIIPTSLFLLAFFLGLGWLVLRNVRAKAKTGVETLLGAEVEAVEYFIDGHGRVRIFGEYWNATEVNHQTVKPGDRLHVEAIDGLNLKLRLLQPTRKD
ncbi:MAG TPA: nodulation protein NfeD [Oligoflexus sp.]|uniref:NfeD family protein n=1 Tax=Oligoflexus sp. TaxID=1971216 RepID=UPI002D6397D4|nr:nodulation protein NfeD [Oligoflexus sp.]HYX32104.1 nodulation protein NfeD [Oligoflexus sp.]